jgi:hypothetical protein
MTEYADKNSGIVTFDLHVRNTGASPIEVSVSEENNAIGENYTILQSCLVPRSIPVNNVSIIEYMIDLDHGIVTCHEKWQYEVEEDQS